MKRFRHLKSARVFRSSVRIVLAAGMAAFGLPAFAVPSSGTAVMQRENVSVLRSSGQALPSEVLLHRVSLVNPPDRECVRHYEKRVRMSPRTFFRKYGATGETDCPNHLKPGHITAGTGSFVCSNDVIALTLHNFVDFNTGGIISKPSQCTIIIKKPNGKQESIRLTDDFIGGADIFRKGLSDAQRKALIKDVGADWAVVRTARRASGVIPYQVFDENPVVKTDMADKDLIAVSGSQTDMDCSTISIGCRIRNAYNPSDLPKNWPRGILSDCDSNDGASGGPDLQKIGGKMTLVAIHSESDDPAGKHAEIKWYRNESANDYKAVRNSTHSVVVERDFLKALTKMCGAENIAHLPSGNPYDETTDSEPPTIGHK
jgi:hypothetical protein